jgi:hypothetical protein
MSDFSALHPLELKTQLLRNIIVKTSVRDKYAPHIESNQEINKN